LQEEPVVKLGRRGNTIGLKLLLENKLMRREKHQKFYPTNRVKLFSNLLTGGQKDEKDTKNSRSYRPCGNGSISHSLGLCQANHISIFNSTFTPYSDPTITNNTSDNGSSAHVVRTT
jgi:hypothetical protein